jgi:hypothetical protein
MKPNSKYVRESVLGLGSGSTLYGTVSARPMRNQTSKSLYLPISFMDPAFTKPHATMICSEQTKLVSTSSIQENIAQQSTSTPLRIFKTKLITAEEHHEEGPCTPPIKSPTHATISRPNTMIGTKQTKLLSTPMVMNDAEGVQQSPYTPLSFFMKQVLMAEHKEGASCTMMILVVEDNCSRLSEESSCRVQSPVHVSYRWTNGALPDHSIRPLCRKASMEEDSSKLPMMMADGESRGLIS